MHHRYNIEFTIGPLLGERDFDALCPADISPLIENGHDRGVSMARCVVKTMRGIWKYARRRKIPLPFDIDELELPTEGRIRDLEVLSLEDITRIREVLHPDNVQYSKHLSVNRRYRHLFATMRARCLFELLLHSGLRISEALALRREDINYETGELRIRNAKHQTEWGTVYIFGAEEYISEYLAIRKDKNPMLFVTYEGDTLSSNSTKSALRCIKKLIA